MHCAPSVHLQDAIRLTEDRTCNETCDIQKTRAHAISISVCHAAQHILGIAAIYGGAQECRREGATPAAHYHPAEIGSDGESAGLAYPAAFADPQHRQRKVYFLILLTLSSKQGLPGLTSAHNLGALTSKGKFHDKNTAPHGKQHMQSMHILHLFRSCCWDDQHR